METKQSLTGLRGAFRKASDEEDKGNEATGPRKMTTYIYK